MASHPSITGLDIRICQSTSEEWIPSSCFHEAQDSLLAGSLEELQSSHVVSEGKSGGVELSSMKSDKNTGNSDCWVEVRSNLKRPTGFFKKQFT